LVQKVESHRRAIWTFRFVAYPTAIALAALAWHEGRPVSQTGVSPAEIKGQALYRGYTAQGERMTAHVRYGRLTDFDTHLRCAAVWAGPRSTMRLRWHARVPRIGSDGARTVIEGRTVWEHAWLPGLRGERVIVDETLLPTANEPPPQSAGAMSLLVARVAGTTVRGSMNTSISLRRADGLNMSCGIGGVRFSLAAI
jgi:hypothetical protein